MVNQWLCHAGQGVLCGTTKANLGKGTRGVLTGSVLGDDMKVITMQIKNQNEVFGGAYERYMQLIKEFLFIMQTKAQEVEYIPLELNEIKQLKNIFNG